MIAWKEYKLGDLVEIGRGASPRPIKNMLLISQEFHGLKLLTQQNQ